MARAIGARAQMALAFESQYGTAPAGGYTRMPFAAVSLGAEQPLVGSELLGYGRDPLAPTRDAMTVDGEATVPIDARAFGLWLKAAFGAPVTTGTDPFTHVFRTGNWSLPSFAIEVGMPDLPRFAMYSGCMLDSLGWQMGRSGNLTAKASIIAQAETIAATTAAGSPAPLALARFGHFHGAVKRNGTALGSLVSAEIAYANTMDRVETIRADGAIDGADPSIAALTGSIVVRFDSDTLVAQAIGGTSCALEFGYTSGAHALTIAAHEVYLPRPRIAIDGPGGIQATFDWQAALNAAEGCMATITLINDQETL